MRTIWLGAVLVLAAACDSGAPSCKDAVAKASAGTGVPIGQQAELTKLCVDKQWSPDVRGCLGRASSRKDVMSCMKSVSADLRELGKSKVEDLEAQAKALADKASDQARAAADSLNEAQKALDANMKDVDAAVDAIAASTDDVTRERAKAALADARTKLSELQAKIAQLKADAARAERRKGVHVSQECLDNPLAPGC